MQGNVIRRKVSPRVGYRCVYRNEYPATKAIPGPIFVAESRIIPVLDEWLSALSASNLDDAVAEMLEHAAALDSEPPEVRRARNIANQAQNKLDRYLDAIEKGMDPSPLRRALQNRPTGTRLRHRRHPTNAPGRRHPRARTNSAPLHPAGRHRRTPPPRQPRRTPPVLPRTRPPPRLPTTPRRRESPSLTRRGVFACRRGDLKGYSPPPWKFIVGPEIWLPAA